MPIKLLLFGVIFLFAFVVSSEAQNKSDNIKSIKIGDQIWMVKNLNVDHYRNGDPIPEVKDIEKWANLKTGAWCYFINDPILGAIYGKLYNGYAVNDPRGLAPVGWHVPSDSEWGVLFASLGGNSVAGGKLKYIDSNLSINDLLSCTSIDGTNEHDFSAIQCNSRSEYGTFIFDVGFGHCSFWTSTKINTYKACGRIFDYFSDHIFRLDFNKGYGLSVRCIKGN